MITAALEKGMPNYMPLTTEANFAAAFGPGRGIPAGPYNPDAYEKDGAVFPSLTAAEPSTKAAEPSTK
jgi:hypothetical protein